MKPIKAAELLIEKIKRDYTDDISLLVIMGSTIYNDTHERSDLDMFFVPKTKRGFNLGFTFIIDGIGYDFWALSWERLERIASHEERIVSIITEGQLLYCATDEDREHWDRLKAKALDVSDRPHLLSKAGEQLDSACIDLVSLINARGLPETRYHAIGLIYKLGQAIALLNGVSIKRGRGKLLNEILAMPLVPQHFKELYNTAFYSNDKNEIISSFAALIEITHKYIKDEGILHTQPRSFKNNWSQQYEEMINAYNKIAHACEINDPVTALFASVELVHEIEEATKYTGIELNSLPDLVSGYDPKDLSKIAEHAKAHQAALEKLLEEQCVSIMRFEDFNELEKHLAAL